MFTNRQAAGKKLARLLQERPLHEPLVLGIPRGGIIVAAALAKELNAELDVVLARKLRAPYYSEVAIGAISEDGEVVRNPSAIDVLKVGEDYLESEKAVQLQQIAQRKERYRAARPAASMTDRSVIVVDDGIATGSTMAAALHVVRHQQVREVIVAVPVACPDRLSEIEALADRCYYLLAPADFNAVGNYYIDFEPVSDEEVLECLQEMPVPH